MVAADDESMKMKSTKMTPVMTFRWHQTKMNDDDDEGGFVRLIGGRFFLLRIVECLLHRTWGVFALTSLDQSVVDKTWLHWLLTDLRFTVKHERRYYR